MIEVIVLKTLKPPNSTKHKISSYVEALTLTVAVLGDGASEKAIKAK